MLVAVALIIVDIVTTAVIASKNDYGHGFLGDVGSNRTSNYMDDVYVKPWCRIAPYAVGLALGYVLVEMFQRANAFSWESLLPQQRTNRNQRVKQILLWTFALTVMAFCIFGTYGNYSGHPLSRSARITFLALSRLGWAIALSAMIIACFSGHGGKCDGSRSISALPVSSLGIVNRILSHACFETLAKLTYGAYLWHALVIVVNYLGRDQPNHYTLANIVRIRSLRTHRAFFLFSSSIASCISSWPTLCLSLRSLSSNCPPFTFSKWPSNGRRRITPRLPPFSYFSANPVRTFTKLRSRVPM